MDVRQQLGGPLGRALGAGAMTVAQLRERGIRLPAVRQDEGAASDSALHEAGQRARRGVRDHVKPHTAGGLAPDFHCAHDQRLVQELAAALEAGLVPPQVGLVDLDLLPQRLPLGVDHSAAELVQERPGRLVADPELPLQLHRRQPGRMGRHQVRGPEPHRQRHPRPMQDRARRHRDLPATRLALPQPPLRQLEGCRRPAVRTAEPLRPSARRQVLPASVLVPESSLELLQRPGEIRSAHSATLRMGAFGVNPISSRDINAPSRKVRPLQAAPGLVDGWLRPRIQELLKEIVPKLARVVVLGNSTTPGNAQALRAAELTAKSFGVQLQYLVQPPKDIETTFREANKGRAEAVLVLTNPVATSQRAQIADLAVKSRLPTIYYGIEFVEDGGLLTYGVSITDLFRRAATYVDKILKGAKPGDLPVEQPTIFELVINMKTARALGIKIPKSILLRADKVIE